jgi:iron complex outermembrane receptor protein
LSRQKLSLFGAAASAALLTVSFTGAVAAEATTAAAASDSTAVGELVVTAQKREENINSVGMSIQAATGDTLQKLGVTNTEDLQKIVPGFVATPNYYGTNVFTIRGVGFQDTSLAGSPTVSVYADEAPLPFSVLTKGATLDIQRVEVLKGPQGTLFGNNATGGAVNYIANKPSDHVEGGVNVSYGRFNDTDLSGYFNTPINDTLDLRIAGRYNGSGPWQKGYALNQGQYLGGKDFADGRLSLLWKPNSRFKSLLSVNVWHDGGYSQAGQLFGIAELSPLAPLSPTIKNYPLAPHNNQAAGWNQCVNISPFDPIANQGAGLTYGTYPNPGPNAKPTGPQESMGPGSVVQAGGQPTDCIAQKKHQWSFDTTLRMDYDLGGDMTVTSLTEFEKFTRTDGIDGSGMQVQDYQSYQRGKITSIYQELRLAGRFRGKGSWLVGANYEHDNTWDSFLQTYNASSASPTNFLNPNFLGGGIFNYSAGATDANGVLLPILGGNTAIPLGPTRPQDSQVTDTYAVFASGEYPILENLKLQGGVRFTEEDKLGGVCGNDGGDGTWAQVAYQLQFFYFPPSTSPAAAKPGQCGSTGLAPTYNPSQPLYYSHLNQNNVSWKVGLDWTAVPGTILYANISQGYKGGSFPTVALASFVQTKPVVQEGLLAYEVGFKSSLLDKSLQVNAAAFYYDYTDKQILGAVADVVYGSLPALVNVPKSHVMGFEVSGAYRPDWFKGLTITPSASYQYSKVDRTNKNSCAPPPAQSNAPAPAGLGPATKVPNIITCKPGDFYGFDAFGEYADFTGEHFPSAPEFQFHIDAEYDWKLQNQMNAFVGVSVAYTSGTNTFFVNRTPTPAYTNVGPNGPDPAFGGYVNCAGAASATAVGPCPTNHPNDPLAVPGYTLVDLRAGIERDNWSFQVWGRNVTNQWYWSGAYHVNDVLLRYTGMPVTYGATFNYKFR